VHDLAGLPFHLHASFKSLKIELKSPFISGLPLVVCDTRLQAYRRSGADATAFASVIST
jgi:hypothetical protein